MIYMSLVLNMTGLERLTVRKQSYQPQRLKRAAIHRPTLFRALK